MSANLEREAQERKRRERLVASLRENLKRRKGQQRGRAGKDEPGCLETDGAVGSEANRAADAGEG